MVFSSLLFLFQFLPVTLLVYYLSPNRVRNAVLVIASLVFYAWGEPLYVFLMIFSNCYERKCQAPHFEHIGETWIFIFKIYVR